MKFSIGVLFLVLGGARLDGQVPDVATFGALGNGIADDSGAIQRTISAGGHKCVIQLAVGKTYMVHSLSLPADCQLRMNNARFVLNQAGGTILTQSGSGPMDDIRPAILDGTFDCNNLPGATIGAVISGSALYMRNVSFRHCDTGYKLFIGQYGEYHNVYAMSNNVGMKLYADPKNGGALDNSWYDCFWYANKVGILAWANSPYPQSDNNFYKARFSDNMSRQWPLSGILRSDPPR